MHKPEGLRAAGPIAHTLISLANLDLGIETCFYNGMDDYG